MINFTKGPWKVGREWIDDGDGSEIEVFSVMAGDEPVTDQPIYEADARLMAKAPEMYAALQRIAFRCLSFIGDDREMKVESIQAILSICDAALAD